MTTYIFQVPLFSLPLQPTSSQVDKKSQVLFHLAPKCSTNHICHSPCMHRKSHPSPTLYPQERPTQSHPILSNHFQTLLFPKSLIKLFHTLLACVWCHQSQHSIQTFDRISNLLLWGNLNHWHCEQDIHDHQGFSFCFSILNVLCCPLASMLFELCCCQLANLSCELLPAGNLALATLCLIC